MWPLPPTRDQVVTVSFYPDHLFLCWIAPDTATTFSVRAHAHLNFLGHELHEGILYNPSSISRHIESFLKQYDVIGASVVFGISGINVQEELVVAQSASTKQPARMLKNIRVWHQEYEYLYPHNDQFVFYTAAINHQTLLQYHLLAINTQLNLIATMPHGSTQLMLYKYIHGALFRHTQLAVDMATVDNDLSALVTQELIARILPAKDPAIDPLMFKHACGLFISHRMMNQ